MSRKDFIDAEFTVVEPSEGTTTSRGVELRQAVEVFSAWCVALALIPVAYWVSGHLFDWVYALISGH
jgi:hypothetical protein